MLRPLLLLLLCLGGAAVAFGWLRQWLSRAGGRHTLAGAELRAIARQARGVPHLQRALEVRARILEALEGRSDEAGLRAQVDAAVRRLAEHDRLRARIAQAVESHGDLPVSASVNEDIDAFEDRAAMLGRLREQARRLEHEGERIVLDLSNLHLALLDLSATETVEDRGALGEALGELASAGETARQQREAEAEIARFLERSRIAARSGRRRG